MKKFLFVLTILLLSASGLFAVTGSATIAPTVVPAGVTGTTFTISYIPAQGVTWTSGLLEIQIPGGWTTPTTSSTSQGYVQAFIVSGSGTSGKTQIPEDSIAILGNLITISGIALTTTGSNSQIVQIVYGSGGGSAGVTVPTATGQYPFSMGEAPDGVTLVSLNGGNTNLTVTVVSLALSKSASAISIVSGTTYIYYINYNNGSTGPADGVWVWDTIPAELNYLSTGTIPAPTTVSNTASGTFLDWYVSGVSAGFGNSITITTIPSSEAVGMAASITNIAMASSSDATVNLQSNACTALIDGVILTVGFYTPSNTILPGQLFTVTMRVADTAPNTFNNISATDVSPTSFTYLPSNDASLISGPSPLSVSVSPGGDNYIQWTFSATAPGTVDFSGTAMGNEVDPDGTTLTRVGTSTTPGVVVIAYATDTPTITRTSTQSPTPTFSPTYTATFTLSPTPTLTNTLTQPPTSTVTDTETLTPAITQTSTIINGQNTTPTYTVSATETNVVSIAPSVTPVVSVSPVYTGTPLPNATMVLSKNYVNPLKGDKLQISVKADAGVNVKIKVYNLTGEVVRDNLGFTTPAAGWNQTEWDVKNGDGKTVAEGLYFVYIEAAGSKKLLKVYVVK